MLSYYRMSNVEGRFQFPPLCTGCLEKSSLNIDASNINQSPDHDKKRPTSGSCQATTDITFVETRECFLQTPSTRHKLRKRYCLFPFIWKKQAPACVIETPFALVQKAFPFLQRSPRGSESKLCNVPLRDRQPIFLPSPPRAFGRI